MPPFPLSKKSEKGIPPRSFDLPASGAGVEAAGTMEEVGDTGEFLISVVVIFCGTKRPGPAVSPPRDRGWCGVFRFVDDDLVAFGLHDTGLDHDDRSVRVLVFWVSVKG